MDAELDYFADKKPDVLELKRAYEYTVNEINSYADQCRQAFDDRRCYWSGKSNDLRKHGSDAFPWDGASDIEVPLISEKINTYVSMCMGALRRSNIRAYPVEISDTGRSKVVSSFLKWMVNSYIDDFYRHMEHNANWLFEKGIIVTYVGWHRETRSYLQELNLEQIASVSPELADIIANGNSDAEIIELFKQQYPQLIEKRAKKALRELRKTGVAKLPVSRRKIDAPCVKALPADGDILFPPYTIDPQQAPQVFYRVYMTPQELMQKVVNDDWDAKWVDEVIEKYRGKQNYQLNTALTNRLSDRFGYRAPNDSDYIEVLYVYQRLIDEEDGSEGIYCTVMHPEYTGDENDPSQPGYAKHSLMNGLEDYPFVCTRLSEQAQRFYDVETFADILRGIQMQVKVERDNRIDKASVVTLPEMTGPAGRAPTDRGPGRYIPERRKGEYGYMPTPAYTPDSVQIEQILISQGDKVIGLDVENPLSAVKQQYFIDKFLAHVRDVLRMAFKMYQLYGPDEVFFRVTGVADPMRFQKGDPAEDFDIIVSFDSQNHDPETHEKRLAQLVNLISMDRNGKIDVDRLLEVAASSIDPVLADAVIQPSEMAQEKMVKQVFEDLTMIYSGIERPARPNGAQIALSIVQQYAQQPDIMQKLQSDEAFSARLQKYAEQYQFALQQMQNAQIGRIGTTPAQVGAVQSQGVY